MSTDPASLVWVGPIYEATGYADEARGLLTALEAAGIPVALRAVRERRLSGFAEQLPPAMRAALRAQEAREPQAPFALVQHFPASGFVPTPSARLQIGRTMFETDGLPGDWVAACNAMDALWLPSAFNVDTFRRAGVRVPMHIVPGGVDSTLFTPDGPRARLPEARGTVFLSIFEWRTRKGWDVLLRAWADAFDAQDDVCLVLRCSVPGRPSNDETAAWLSTQIDAFLRDVVGRDRASVAPIILLPQVIAADDLPALYRAADAYVSPTRGEGWGRPFMEAMATGLPVIATRWSAHLAYMTDDTSLLVDVDRLVPAMDPELSLYAGTRWAEPSTTELVRQLRRVADDRAGAQQIGARARTAMREQWSWAEAASTVRDALAEMLPTLRTPRAPRGAATHPCRLRPFAPTDTSRDSTPPRLWFAMLTYNALAYTRRAIASLDRTTDEPWRLFILDNGSTDGTREWLATLRDPRIEVAESATNRGVAGGRNDIVARLRDRVPDDGFIIFVDNDLEFFPGWLDPYRRVIAQVPALGMLSSSGFEIVVHTSHRELLSYPALVPLSVDVTSGGFACFVRPAVFDAIGGYDEALNPFWHEDDDITVRARAAGFETMAAPGLGIVHHGHKSGAAIPALVHGGSRSKQAYLVDKWRQAGWVAPDGRLKPGRAAAADEIAAAMSATMRRGSPCMAGEVERARLDAMLVASDVNGPPTANASANASAIEGRPRYASAPALAWAEAQAARLTAERIRWEPVAAHLRNIRESRRRLTRLAHPTGAPPLSGLADSRHWEHDDWFALATEAAGDGRGRLQWYDRSAAVWDATQVARAFATHRATRPAARIVVIGDLRRPIVWHLAEHADALVVGDILTRHGASAVDTTLTHVERFALRDVPPDRVAAYTVEALATVVAPGSVDLAVVLPWETHAAVGDVTALMQFVSPLLAPTGWLCATLPTRLGGPPDARVLDSPQRLAATLARIGLTPLDQPDLALSDEGLLAATDLAGVGVRTPDLLVVDGPRLSGRLFVTAMRITEAGI